MVALVLGRWCGRFTKVEESASFRTAILWERVGAREH